jgi:RHS repeat-associated protein
VTSYTYDTANRLSSALVSTTTGSLGTTPQFAYGYDRASNLTSITANEPAQSFTATATNGLTAGTYDANGNTTALSGRSFAWDGANRVVSFTSGTSKSRFYYDGMSRLVRVVDESQGRVVADHAYFWCGTDRCLAHDNTQAGSPVSAQYFAQGVIENDTPYYYVTDRLGSVRQLVNAGGDVVAQYDYDPYGNQAKISGAVSSDFGYAGYFEHAASGLDFAMYRAYDSNHARWLNRDPIAEAGGINLYEYVGDSPIARRDPTGLCDQKPCQWMTNNGNWTNSIVQGGIWAAAGVGGGLVAGGGVLSVPAGVGLGLIGFGDGFFGSFTYSWCL